MDSRQSLNGEVFRYLLLYPKWGAGRLRQQQSDLYIALCEQFEKSPNDDISNFGVILKCLPEVRGRHFLLVLDHLFDTIDMHDKRSDIGST